MDEKKPDRIEGRIKEGEFREWYFPAEEVLEWTKKFMQQAGYELLPTTYINFVHPDFHARRQTEKTTHEIVGMVCQHTDVGLDGLAKLAAMWTELGDNVDYVLVLPPISEYLMLEFLRFDEGRWYLEMKKHDIMFWLSNPDEEFVWCLLGGPRDRQLERSFVSGRMPLDGLMAMQFSPQRWEEED